MLTITVNSFVDHVYVINLERRPDRLARVSATLARHGISFTRWVAVDGGDTTVREQWQRARRDGSHVTTAGAYACLQSHLSVVRDAKDRGYGRILVLEDDVLLHRDFAEEFRRVRCVPSFGILYLGATQLDRSPVRQEYYRADKTYGLFAYVVSDVMYDPLIELWGRAERNADHGVHELQGRYPCYVMWPNLMIADLGTSDTDEVRGEPLRRGEKKLRMCARLLGWRLDVYGPDR